MLAHLGAILRDDPVEAEELDKEGVRVLLHMCHVLGKQLQQQLHFPLCISPGMLQSIWMDSAILDFDGNCQCQQRNRRSDDLDSGVAKSP